MPSHQPLLLLAAIFVNTWRTAERVCKPRADWWKLRYFASGLVSTLVRLYRVTPAMTSHKVMTSQLEFSYVTIGTQIEPRTMLSCPLRQFRLCSKLWGQIKMSSYQCGTSHDKDIRRSHHRLIFMMWILCMVRLCIETGPSRIAARVAVNDSCCVTGGRLLIGRCWN